RLERPQRLQRQAHPREDPRQQPDERRPEADAEAREGAPPSGRPRGLGFGEGGGRGCFEAHQATLAVPRTWRIALRADLHVRVFAFAMELGRVTARRAAARYAPDRPRDRGARRRVRARELAARSRPRRSSGPRAWWGGTP